MVWAMPIGLMGRGSGAFTVTTLKTDAVLVASSSTLSLTTVADAPAGSLIVILAGNANSRDISSVADSAGNSYAVDVNGTGVMRAGIASAANISHLASGSTITITFSGASTNRKAGAFLVSGAATTTPKDKTAAATGTSTTPSSGNTAATSQASEIAFGIVAWAAGATATEDTNFTRLLLDGSGSTNKTNYAYRILTATGAQAYAPTLGSSLQWSCAIATYKHA